MTAAVHAEGSLGIPRLENSYTMTFANAPIATRKAEAATGSTLYAINGRDKKIPPASPAVAKNPRGNPTGKDPCTTFPWLEDDCFCPCAPAIMTPVVTRTPQKYRERQYLIKKKYLP